MTREIQYAPLFHKYGVVTLIFAAATLGTLMCPSHHWAQEQTHNPEKLSADPDAPGSEHEQEDALFPLQREIWFQQQRAYPNAHIPPGAYWRAQVQKRALAARHLAMFRAISPELVAQADPLSAVKWTADGPQPMVAYPGGPPYSGRATAIAVHPTDPNTIYLGTAGGGVWKTTDGGTTWIPLTDDQASLAIGAIAIDPNNPNIVFAGTGEPNFSIDSYYGQGLLKSTDAGATWTLIRTPFLTSYANGDSIPDFTAIAVQPGNSNVVLAANLTRGLYRSADGGETWTQVINPGGIAGVTAVMFDVKNASVVYAGYGGDFPTITGTVFKSTDAGLTWTVIDGSGANAVPVNTAVLRTALAEDAAGVTLYAAFAHFNGTAPGSLYSTTNGGATWTQLSPPSINDGLDYYCNAIAVVPGNPLVLYASGGSLFQSTDGGHNWSTIPIGKPVYFDQHAFAFSPDGSKMYLADDGGIFVTSNPTVANPTFTSLNTTINTNTFYPGFSIVPGQPNSLLAGSQDHGLNLYTGTLAWPGGWNFCGDGGAAYVDPQGLHAYAHCEGAGPNANWLASSDVENPGSWAPAESGINLSDPQPWVADVKGDPQTISNVYTATNHLYQSTNFAASWTSISPDLTAGSSTITTIGISPTDSNTIYTGAGDGTVSVTHNALSGTSATWTTLSGLPKRSISKIIVQPDSPQDVYITVSGFDSGHVFHSTNGGSSWTDISGDLPNTPVNSILVDPNVLNSIYVATDTGVYATLNGGTNWTTLGQGLPNVVVQDILMYEPTRTLRVITHGRGAWDATVPEIGLQGSESTLQFADQTQGTMSASQSVTFSNNLMSGSLSLTGLQITGPFAQTNNCGASLAPSATCTVNVTFLPTTAGSMQGSLILSSNTNNVTVGLSGTGLGIPEVALGGSSLAFSPQLVASTGASQTVTVANTGNGSLTFTAIATTGPFAIAASGTTCSTSNPVGAAATCTVAVTFTPTATGTASGSLSFTDNAPNSPQTVALSGTGLGPSVSLSASPIFPSEPVGTTSSPQTVTLTNTGNGSLTFKTIGVSGPFTIGASETTCSTSNTVAAGGNCTVAITFTPTAAGTASGSLSFTDNAPNSPQTVALSGTGQDFTLTAASGSSTSASVAPGSPASYTLSVAGEEGFNQNVSFTCTGAPSEAVCTASPNPVTAGSSATNVTVNVTTTASSVNAPHSRPLPPIAPLSQRLKGLWMLTLVLGAMAWVIMRRKQSGLTRWQSSPLLIACGLLLALALAECGGGGGGGGGGPTPNPGTPAGTYTLTVTGTAGSGSSALSHSMKLTLKVS